MNKKTLEAYQQAVSDLMRDDAFLAGIIVQLQVETDDRYYMAATDGSRLALNPVRFAEMGRNTRELILVHEAEHIALKHHLRQPAGVDQELWNAACDHAINSGLCNRPGWKGIEDFAFLPSRYGMPNDNEAEWYLKELQAATPPPPPPPPPPESGEEEQDQEGEAGEGDGDGTEGDEGNEQDGGEGEAEDGEEEGDAGESSPGSGKEDGEDGKDGTGGTGEGSPLAPTPPPGGDQQGQEPVPSVGDVIPPKDGEDHALAEIKWEETMSNAISTAMAAGTGVGNALIQKVRDLMTPSVNWKIVMRQWLLRRAKVKRTFERPNRRMLWNDRVVFPSKGGKTLGHVVFGVDTSGSMNQEALDQSLEEMESLMKQYPDTRLTLIQWDTHITFNKDVTAADLAAMRNKPAAWYGRGGTNPVEVLHYIKSSACDVAVMLTDGYIPYWGEPSGKPVLWLITSAVKAPWGHTVPVNIERKNK